MKSGIVSFMIFIFGFMIIIVCGCVVEYTSAYKSIAFDLRHAIMESGKEAIIPRISYIDVPCVPSTENEDYCSADGYQTIEVIEYMEEEEYFQLLVDTLKKTKKHPQDTKVTLLYFENNPLVVHASLQSKVNGIFVHQPIEVDEALVQDQ